MTMSFTARWSLASVTTTVTRAIAGPFPSRARDTPAFWSADSPDHQVLRVAGELITVRNRHFRNEPSAARAETVATPRDSRIEAPRSSSRGARPAPLAALESTAPARGDAENSSRSNLLRESSDSTGAHRWRSVANSWGVSPRTVYQSRSAPAGRRASSGSFQSAIAATSESTRSALPSSESSASRNCSGRRRVDVFSRLPPGTSETTHPLAAICVGSSAPSSEFHVA